MLAQITQMLKDQNLHLNKVETALKWLIIASG
jgi:hypothetical protein